MKKHLRNFSSGLFSIIAVVAFVFNANCQAVLTPAPPTVTTLAPLQVSSTTAYLSGLVNANGYATNTSFQYGLTASYGSTVLSGTITGNTPVNTTGYVYPLIPGQQYHYRAVGTNAGGTAYGNDVTFTTPDTLPEVFTHYAGNVGSSTATLNGSVYPNGATTSITFNYGPTASYGSTVTANPATISGDSLYTWASAPLTGLTPNTTYHFRITGVNSSGTAHGNDSVFTTTSNLPPTVITNQATAVTSTGATLNGHVNPNGTSTTVTFQYGLTTAYGTTVTYGNMGGNSLDPVSKTITGLTPGTLYHFRVVGANPNGTSYGNDSVFTTLTILPPTVATNPVSISGAKYAYLSGTFNANGNQTAASFQCGLTTSYGMTVQAGNVSGTTPVTIDAAIYGLYPNHVYHYRAVGTNAGGTVYGNDVTFTTSDTLAEVFTYQATNIGPNTAILHGLVYPNGSTTAITFDYGLTASYGSTIAAGTPTISGDSLSTWAYAVLTGLTPNTTYHYRIKGVNASGTSYGTDTVFTTSPIVTPPPTVITSGAVYFTATNAVMRGYVNANGSPATVSFQYGLTASYGSTATYGTVYGNTMTPVYAQATDLSPATLYHYRVLGANAGGTVYGLDTTFMTNDSTLCDAQYTYQALPLAPYTIHFTDHSAGNINSWAWDFGDGSPVSTVRNPIHTYQGTALTYNVCLTVHGADSSCYDIICQPVPIITDTNCQSYFTYAPIAGPGYSYAFTDLSVTTPISWAWNFDDPAAGTGNFSSLQNPVHVYTSPGTYSVCLSIVTAGNCTSTFCKALVVADSVTSHHLYGQVFAAGVPIQSGVVNLFSVDTIPPYAPYLDISNIDTTGTYNFYEVPDGNYFINAIPVGQPGYLPTFYGDVLYWEDATIIHVGTPVNPYDINLLNAAPMNPGNGTINGQINISGLKTNYVGKITMLLFDLTGRTRYELVEPDGKFAFSSLDYGIYFLKAEMAGISSQMIKVILSQENQDPAITMTFTGNSITGINNPAPGITSWVVFPNPVADQVSISLDMNQGMEVIAEIHNLTGQLLSDKTFNLNSGKNTVSLSTASLPYGVYTLRLYSKEGVNIYTKLVKVR